MRRSWHKDIEIQILIWIGILVGFFLIAAGFIQFFESSHPESSIRTYSQALWYSLVTISTVGYGDYYPVSSQGQFIGSIIIVFSLGFAGFIVGKIQTSVTENIRRKNLGMKGCDFRGHYVVFGWNPKSYIVVQELLKADNNVGILADTESELTEIDNAFHKQRKMVFKTFGPSDSEEIYERLNLAEAVRFILVFQDDTMTLISALNLRKAFPKVQIIAHIGNPALKETISSAGVTYVVSSNEIVGRMIASAAFEPEVSRVLEDLLSGAEGEEEYDIQQFRVPPNAGIIGSTVGDLEQRMRKADAGRLLAVSVNVSDGGRKIEKDPRPDMVIGAQHILMVIVNGQQARHFRSVILDVKQGER